jgi:hypothetical protein
MARRRPDGTAAFRIWNVLGPEILLYREILMPARSSEFIKKV